MKTWSNRCGAWPAGVRWCRGRRPFLPAGARFWFLPRGEFQGSLPPALPGPAPAHPPEPEPANLARAASLAHRRTSVYAAGRNRAAIGSNSGERHVIKSPKPPVTSDRAFQAHTYAHTYAQCVVMLSSYICTMRCNPRLMQYTQCVAILGACHKVTEIGQSQPPCSHL
jgi:hypothetical protein